MFIYEIYGKIVVLKGEMMEETLLTKLDKYTISYIIEKNLSNYSINTISTYNRILNDFYEFMVKYENNIKFSDINKDIVLEYVNYNIKSSNSTKQLKLTVLKSFFKYIEINDDKYLFIKELSKINIKIDSKEVESLTNDEEKRLLDLFKKESKSFNFNRDKLIVNILLFCGIRATELLNIEFDDISEVEEGMFQILIKGKGSKQRYAYIAQEKIKEQLEYLKQFSISYIIFTNKYNSLDRVGLYRVVSNKMKKANINKKGIHILRHTFAKKLVAKNINLSTIKDLLGHEDISTTMIYAKTNEENKIMAVKRL